MKMKIFIFGLSMFSSMAFAQSGPGDMEVLETSKKREGAPVALVARCKVLECIDILDDGRDRCEKHFNPDRVDVFKYFMNDFTKKFLGYVSIYKNSSDDFDNLGNLILDEATVLVSPKNIKATYVNGDSGILPFEIPRGKNREAELKFYDHLVKKIPSYKYILNCNSTKDKG